MKTRLRIFLAILVTVGIGFALLVKWFTDDLKPQYRAATEEPLVDTAWLLAAMAASHVHDGVIDPSFFQAAIGQSPKTIAPAAIYNFLKTSLDLRIYMTDATGKVIFDSAGRDIGVDYSRWNDVILTLQGKYGTRTTHDAGVTSGLSVMYVAAPVQSGGKTVGVVSVGKPTDNVSLFIERAQRKMIVGGGITFIVVLLTTLIVSTLITRPIERLTAYVRALGSGRRQALPRLGGGEIGQLGRAFEEMRTALEGKQYVENYVQTLTHEMKSPIAAIQGAIELLREEMPVERRERFLGNIEAEGQRMQRLIERLLLLSSIEAKNTLQKTEEINLVTLVGKTAGVVSTACANRGVITEISGDRQAMVRVDSFLVE